MKTRMKIVLAATAVGLGLAATPGSAQVLGGTRGGAYADRPVGYHNDGTLNVFGAHIDPQANRAGLAGGVGNVVGGVGSAVGGVVGGVAGAADDVVTGSIGPRRSDVVYRDRRPVADDENDAY